MEAVVPWSRLLAVIEPHYPKAGDRTDAGDRPGALYAAVSGLPLCAATARPS
jgi:hypothetical protein